MATRPSNRERNRWTLGLIAPRDGEALLEIGCGRAGAGGSRRTRLARC
ncbi:MAG: hypothetical protein H6891_11730 [Brucellaceae bacterium]|nr:hypothetical protein [Brucellaceae bacterium]